MKVAIDGGALCAAPGHQFGTYRFTNELLQALSLYGTHEYTVYSFCEVPEKDRYAKLHYRAVRPSFGWMKFRLPFVLSQDKPDVFFAVNQVVPMGFQGMKIVFSHGLSFYFYPDYYPSDYQRLQNQLDAYVKEADTIIVSSEMVKEELQRIAPLSRVPVVALPFGLFAKEPEATQKGGKQDSLKRQPDPYFIYVGSDQPIKNVSGLIHAFTEFRKANKTMQCKLLLVGINRRDLPAGVEQMPFADYQKLQKLYANAAAYVSCSYYESFNYPVLEALQNGCPVIALKTAITPEQEPFVQMADTIEELSFLMEKAAQGAFEMKNAPEIGKVFDWERYVKKLEIIMANNARKR